jgi:hypothetical protein
VNEIDDQLRQLFLRKAADVAPHREVPRSLVTRARRRIALNALSVGIGVVVLATGAFVGVRALSGPPARQPIGHSTRPPVRPTTSGAPVAECASAQLRAVASLEGAAGSRVGAIVLTNASDAACTLQGRPDITVLNHNGDPITSGVTFTASSPQWAADGSPQPKDWPVVTLQPGDRASVRIGWSNWCLDGGAVPTWRMGIPAGGTVDVSGLDASTVAPCNGPGQPSTIQVGPFEPRAGP